jgi:hypothetical protein
VQLHLAPLTIADTAALVAATLAWSVEQARPLARFIHARSDGNPLFVRSLLRWLHEQQLLRFDGEAGAWHWDAGQAASAGVDEDLGALLTRKLAELSPPPAPRSSSPPASATASPPPGSRLSSGTGARTPTPRSPRRSPAASCSASQALADDDPDADPEPTLEFAHEHVQQAAYALAEPARRVHLHLRLGRSLLADDPTGAGESLFAITGHLNLAAALIDDPREQLHLAELNLAAARRARQATAHAVAAQHVAHGCALLPTTPGPPTMRCASRCTASAWSASTSPATSRPRWPASSRCSHSARDDLDRGEIHDLKVRLDVTRECYLEATRTGLAGLRLLGVDLPERATQPPSCASSPGVRWHRGLRSFAALAALPEVRDPKIRLALRLLARINIPAYYVDEPTLARRRPALRRPLDPPRRQQRLRVGFAVYAAIALNRLEDPAAARDLWAVAHALGERFPSPALAVRMAIFGGHLRRGLGAALRPAATRHRRPDRARPRARRHHPRLDVDGRHVDLQWLGAGTLAQIERTLAGVRPVARPPARLRPLALVHPDRARLPGPARPHRRPRQHVEPPTGRSTPSSTSCAPSGSRPTFFYAIYKAALLIHAGRYREAELLALQYHRVRLEGAPLLAELLLLRILARTAQTPDRPLTAPTAPTCIAGCAACSCGSAPAPRTSPRGPCSPRPSSPAPRASDDARHPPLHARRRGRARAGPAARRGSRARALRPAPARRRHTGLSDMYFPVRPRGLRPLGRRRDRRRPRPRAPAARRARRPGRARRPRPRDDHHQPRRPRRRGPVARLPGDLRRDRARARCCAPWSVSSRSAPGPRRCAVLLARGDGELRVEALAELESVQVLQGLTLADAHLPASVVQLAAAAGATSSSTTPPPASSPATSPSPACAPSCAPRSCTRRAAGRALLDNELAPGIFTADRIALLRQLAGQVAISVENARLYRNLAQARDAAVAADRTKTRFLMNMSHELRTPLNAVLGYTELIQESAADGDLTALHTDLDKIRRAANRLLQTLGSILELSRVEAGDLRPAPEPTRPARARPRGRRRGRQPRRRAGQPDPRRHRRRCPAARQRPRMLLHAVRSSSTTPCASPPAAASSSPPAATAEGAAWIAVRVQDTASASPPPTSRACSPASASSTTPRPATSRAPASAWP